MTVQTAQTQELSRPETQKEEGEKRVYTPRADVLEKTDSFAIVAELPGGGASSLAIEVEKNVLSIKGKSADQGPEGYNRVVGEYVGGDYERRFTLSDRIDTEGITASIDKGVLTVILPKTKEASSRRIEVKTA